MISHDIEFALPSGAIITRSTLSIAGAEHVRQSVEQSGARIIERRALNDWSDILCDDVDDFHAWLDELNNC